MSQEALAWDHVYTEGVRPHSAGGQRVDAGRSRPRLRPASAGSRCAMPATRKLLAGEHLEKFDPRRVALKMKRTLQLMPRGSLTTDEWEQLFR